MNRVEAVPAMASVHFTQNLRRHIDCPAANARGATVRELLDHVFADNPRLRDYILDERGAVRKHMVVFVDGQAITDRDGLSDPVRPGSQVYVMQALSGG
jgi:sulfur-carrier protein